MLYLFIGTNSIKLLCLKKSMLGQYEALFFEKTHETQLLDKGKPVNSDVLASAVKEAMNLASNVPLTEKEVCLILPQDAFLFMRTEVPADIAPSAVNSFIKDKSRSSLPLGNSQSLSDYITQESGTQKTVMLFSLEKTLLQLYQQSLSLINLKIKSVVPETLAYFKLFDKTLRKEKKESIAYVNYDNNLLSGFLYDSNGLVDPEKWRKPVESKQKIETILKEKVDEYQEKNIKLNRVILSGSASDGIRQDTFTKAIGVWTNPLKRIIPTFYNDYLKMLVVEKDKILPILSFDVCFGAFVFQQENKTFSLLKNGYKIEGGSGGISLPSVPKPRKEIFIFIGSFLLSFAFFIALTYLKPSFNLNFLSKKTNQSVLTPTPAVHEQPSPTPTPSVQRSDLKIKILNGSGTAGKAGDVKTILKDKGYGEILTGNADSFDYATTELELKKTVQDAASLLKTDLSAYVSNMKISDLSATDAADVVIIVGKDFK